MIESQDEEKGQELSKVFAELAITHMDHILSGQIQVVDVMVQLLEKIPQLTCKQQKPFWKALFKRLGQENQQKLEQFGPLFLRLIACLQ